MKADILRLRDVGYSYDEIAEELGCSKGTIAYHCGVGVREKFNVRQRKKRKEFTTTLKENRGGKCELCGYSKCLAVLHFHHIDPSKKTRVISSNKKINGLTHLSHYVGHKHVENESKKCVLVCANCHGEIHAGIRINPSVA